MTNLLAVVLGGALGSVLRFGIQKWLNVSLPWGTLTVNILGCFLAGWLWAKYSSGLNEPLFLFAMTGFCGGFTTFSAFSVENVQMMTSGNWQTAFFYTVVSLTGGFAATFIGYKIFSA